MIIVARYHPRISVLDDKTEIELSEPAAYKVALARLALPCRLAVLPISFRIELIQSEGQLGTR